MVNYYPKRKKQIRKLYCQQYKETNDLKEETIRTDEFKKTNMKILINLGKQDKTQPDNPNTGGTLIKNNRKTRKMIIPRTKNKNITTNYNKLTTRKAPIINTSQEEEKHTLNQTLYEMSPTQTTLLNY